MILHSHRGCDCSRWDGVRVMVAAIVWLHHHTAGAFKIHATLVTRLVSQISTIIDCAAATGAWMRLRWHGSKDAIVPTEPFVFVFMTNIVIIITTIVIVIRMTIMIMFMMMTMMILYPPQC